MEDGKTIQAPRKTGSFEDLEAWSQARALTKWAYRATRLRPVAKDNRLCDQLRGAALSIMNNIAEGWESLSPGEKRQCYGYARRSCGEVRSMIYVLVDNFPETPDELIEEGWDTCLHAGKLITGLIAAAERQAKRKATF